MDRNSLKDLIQVDTLLVPRIKKQPMEVQLQDQNGDKMGCKLKFETFKGVEGFMLGRGHFTQLFSYNYCEWAITIQV